METGWKLLIIVALVLASISLFVSGLQRFTTTETNRVYLETEIIQDEGWRIVLLNAYDYHVYDVYVVFKLENREHYSVERRDMLGANVTLKYGPWPDRLGNYIRVVDAYAYGVKP